MRWLGAAFPLADNLGTRVFGSSSSNQKGVTRDTIKWGENVHCWINHWPLRHRHKEKLPNILLSASEALYVIPPAKSMVWNQVTAD